MTYLNAFSTGFGVMLFRRQAEVSLRADKQSDNALAKGVFPEGTEAVLCSCCATASDDARACRTEICCVQMTRRISRAQRTCTAHLKHGVQKASIAHVLKARQLSILRRHICKPCEWKPLRMPCSLAGSYRPSYGLQDGRAWFRS